jgi:hypothetical protein
VTLSGAAGSQTSSARRSSMAPGGPCPWPTPGPTPTAASSSPRSSVANSPGDRPLAEIRLNRIGQGEVSS